MSTQDGRTIPGTRRRPRRTGLRAALARFRRREDGAASIEFAIIFPVFIGLFLAAFELGFFMTRQVMLDRATDITVRALRLGKISNPDLNTLRNEICSHAGLVLPNCQASVLIDILEVPLQNWTPPTVSAECIERDPDGELKPVSKFLLNPGQANDMMLIRICALQEPVFPTTYLGLGMQNYGKFYALVTTSAFVVEPTT